MKNIFQPFVISLFFLTMPSVASEQMDVAKYVQQIFVRGIPYEEASEYDAFNVAVLQSMLREPEYLAHWGKIAVMISIIGDEAVAEIIIDFIENDTVGDFGREHLRAKKNALFGMGYLVNRTQSKVAERYLIEGLSPSVWEKREVRTLGKYNDEDSRNNYLSKAALLGLSLSGTEETLQAVLKLESTNKSESKFRENIEDMLDNVIATNSEIKARGLGKYYEARNHKHN